MMSSFRIGIKRISTSNFSSYSMLKDARRLQKMINRMSDKKKPKHSPVLLTTSSQPAAYDNDGSSKRLANLNKRYMEEISLMINGGTYKSQLSDLGVQITKVKMAKGLNFLHIYWITMEKDIDEEYVNKILANALAELQQEMGSIRFTSKVPLLKFVRDKRLEDEFHLEEVFRSADFGKDFKPAYETKVFTPDFVHTGMKFPEMRQDVLGLDHAKIKEKIERKILKFRAVNIEWIEEEEQEEKEFPLPEKLIVFTHKDFTRFFRRRIVLEIKMKKKLARKCKNNEEFVDEEEESDEEEYYEDYFKNLYSNCENYYKEEEEEEQYLQAEKD